MKTYGQVLADNGSPWYFQGEAVDGWSTDLLDELTAVPASAFEAVDTSSLRVTADSQRIPAVAVSPAAWRSREPAPHPPGRTTPAPAGGARGADPAPGFTGTVPGAGTGRTRGRTRG